MEAMIQGISPKEAVNLGATSLTMYGKLFFPKTFRQDSPKFHDDVGRALYAPENRQVAIEVFRDGAKTTLLRTFTSQRVAYAISRTILFVSASQGHSILSIRWIKRQVEFNKIWANTFRLRKGSKWSDDVIEVWNDTIGAPITIMALGITGQLRGFNIDDHRPDLIICDDSSTDEMTATAEQRKKYEDIFFGALINSLAPSSECPEAKAVLLDTPKSKFDLIETCMGDPAWVGLRFGVFDAQGESRWPTRYPTDELRKAKESYILKGRLPLWMKEKECKIIAEELASFRVANLRYWELLPEQMTRILAIDPASSDDKKADDNVVAVLGFYRDDVYIIDYVAATGQDPEMVTKTVFEFMRLYRPLGVVVESIGYQRVLAWYLEKAMREQRMFLPVYKIQDKRSKPDRIVQALSETSAFGRLLCRAAHTKFIEQFTEYSPTFGGHDDVLDAVAMGVTWATNQHVSEWLEGEFTEVDDADDYPKLNFRAAP